MLDIIWVSMEDPMFESLYRVLSQSIRRILLAILLVAVAAASMHIKVRIILNP